VRRGLEKEVKSLHRGGGEGSFNLPSLQQKRSLYRKRGLSLLGKERRKPLKRNRLRRDKRGEPSSRSMEEKKKRDVRKERGE